MVRIDTPLRFTLSGNTARGDQAKTIDGIDGPNADQLRGQDLTVGDQVELLPGTIVLQIHYRDRNEWERASAWMVLPVECGGPFEITRSTSPATWFTELITSLRNWIALPRPGRVLRALSECAEIQANLARGNRLEACQIPIRTEREIERIAESMRRTAIEQANELLAAAEECDTVAAACRDSIRELQATSSL